MLEEEVWGSLSALEAHAGYESSEERAVSIEPQTAVFSELCQPWCF